MPSQKGRDLLLKIGDGATPTEAFATIGAARTNNMTINNNPIDATTMEDDGVQTMLADAGVQSMSLSIEGVFKDSAAEELLRAQAFARTAVNYELTFPNGDEYAGSFVVQDYVRGGTHDGLETFSCTLVRTGDGVFTAAS
jgi:TP901-1 family phage major tail protein